MKSIAILAVLILSACGIDGEPVPKGGGIDVSGTVKIGVSGEF